jgi:L-alanine-DL-glutamate epimerase-like enolase superfamily enzyme
MINRRNFVKMAGMAGTALSVNPLMAGSSQNGTPIAAGMPVIKNITVFKATGNFNRFISMNAYDRAPKGINENNPFIKIELSDGTTGIGPGGYAAPNQQTLNECKSFIGKDPFTFYDWDKDRITGVKAFMQPYFFKRKYAWLEAPLLDAIGKIKQAPVWRLLGESVREGLDPYDGTVYFEDIGNNTGVKIIAETAKRIKNEGYRAIKIKLGRPLKWMPGEAGLNRDIEAFIALREAVGSNFILMADANNGYEGKFDWAVKLMSSCARYDLFFMEELFKKDNAQFRKMRASLLEENIFVPVTYGELVTDLSLFEQDFKEGVYSYVQPDMASSGISAILDTAKKAEPYPYVKVMPHVWQNAMGTIMAAHASKIRQNIPLLEDSRYFEHILHTDAIQFRGGQYILADKPGWGVDLSANYKEYLVGEEMVIV